MPLPPRQAAPGKPSGTGHLGPASPGRPGPAAFEGLAGPAGPFLTASPAPGAPRGVRAPGPALARRHLALAAACAFLALWAAGLLPGLTGFPEAAGFARAQALAAMAPAHGGDGYGGAEDPYPRLEKRLKKVISEKGIQTELPYSPPDAAAKPRQRQRRLFTDITRPVTFARVVAAMAGAGVLILAAILLHKARQSRRLKKEAPKQDSSGPQPSVRAALGKALLDAREEADSLAAGGLFMEAVHALLLKGLEAFRRRDRDRVPPHLTSRELLPALPLNAVEDSTLRELVFLTEASWFGGAAVGATEYARARESFGKLLASVSPAAAGAAGRPKASGAASSPQAASDASRPTPEPSSGSSGRSPASAPASPANRSPSSPSPPSDGPSGGGPAPAGPS
ncbi:MAG: hypothetical protein LBW85_01480 [Deltaproteobacteria bacterium]|nr:hypothetical protein [Deltaproteobacteria bacterium]